MKSFKSIICFIIKFIGNITKKKVSVYAAQASFFILLSAIPFLMLLLGLAKYFIPFSKPELLSIMSNLLPQNFYYWIADIINELFSKTPGTFISITTITMVWSASRGVLAIIQGLNAIFEAENPGFIKIRIIAFFYTLLFLLMPVLTLAILLLCQTLLTQSLFIYVPVLFILLTLAFSAFYTFLPSKRLSLISQLSGAFLCSISWIGFTWLYSLYIDNFSNYSYIYGSLAAIILLMLWLYFCVNIFLYGAEFNQMLIEKNTKKTRC